MPSSITLIEIEGAAPPAAASYGVRGFKAEFARSRSAERVGITIESVLLKSASTGGSVLNVIEK